MDQFAGALLTPHYFTFGTIVARVARSDRWEPTPNQPFDPPLGEEDFVARLCLREETRHPYDFITVPPPSKQKGGRRRVNLASALQSGTTQGLPPRYYIFRGFTRKHMHPNCRYKKGPKFLLACGDADGFAKVLLALTSEWSWVTDGTRDRDALLVKKFCYTPDIKGVRARGVTIVPIEIYSEGMIIKRPGGPKDVLEIWDFMMGRRPSLMYFATQVKESGR